MVNSLYYFEPFSLVHFGVIALFTVLWAAAIAWAARWRHTSRLNRFEKGFAIFTLLVWVVAEGYWLLPERFTVAYSLPIQVCDLTALMVPLAFFFKKRLLITLLYFWGIGVSINAVVTPDLHHGPAQFEFWLFWSYHGLIIGAAVYFLVVERYRPTWRDYGKVILSGAVYLAVVIPMNIIYGFNYGYMGNTHPSQPTLIDLLGPWPERMFIIWGLFLVVMTLLVLPWELYRRFSGRQRL